MNEWEEYGREKAASVMERFLERCQLFLDSELRGKIVPIFPLDPLFPKVVQWIVETVKNTVAVASILFKKEFPTTNCVEFLESVDLLRSLDLPEVVLDDQLIYGYFDVVATMLKIGCSMLIRHQDSALDHQPVSFTVWWQSVINDTRQIAPQALKTQGQPIISDSGIANIDEVISEHTACQMLVVNMKGGVEAINEEEVVVYGAATRELLRHIEQFCKCHPDFSKNGFPQFAQWCCHHSKKYPDQIDFRFPNLLTFRRWCNGSGQTFLADAQGANSCRGLFFDHKEVAAKLIRAVTKPLPQPPDDSSSIKRIFRGRK